MKFLFNWIEDILVYILMQVRIWKIKLYKNKKIVETKHNPEKLYHIHFKVSIKDKDGIKDGGTIYDIKIPATGYYYAKKSLMEFVFSNTVIEIVKPDLSMHKEQGHWENIEEKVHA